MRSLKRSIADHVFSLAPQVNTPRSVFDRGFGVKTTFDAGYLVPILVDEMLPGDTFNLSMQGFARLATPAVPIMDNLYMETFFFFVPNRLVWDHWEHLCGYQKNPGDSTDYLVPQLIMPESTGAGELSLSDYFGIPTKVPELAVSALPYRAYNLIYNEWFRDENLQDSVVVNTADSGDLYSDYTLLRRGKRHDYFTSCLPWPQKGPDVTLPLGTTAPIVPENPASYPTFGFSGGETANLASSSPGGNTVLWNASISSGIKLARWADPNLIVDLSDASAATVNQLRLAFQTQKLYERDARGGTRYFEICQSHFGVTNPDLRLQRPHYLGGGHTPILVNPVAQTSGTVAPDQPLGRLGAYGVAAPSGHGFSYSSTEHGYVIGLICVRADINYQQGLDRHWSRRSRLDFYWPALAHIGEQAVLNKEIFAQGTLEDDDVFGYQERFAEYRYKPSTIAGLFRSNCAQPLDMWHLAQDFEDLPVLGDLFIQEIPPIERIEAFPDEVDFIFDSVFSYRCVRPMPVYSVPGKIDHF